MLDALAITEEDAQGLVELAALDLAMAKDFAARAQAAEDPAVASDLARSYQRAARSYRQTLMLKMRLARELSRAEHEAAVNPPPFDPRAARRRMDELRDAAVRVAHAEYEPAERQDELEDALGLLDEMLIDFAAEPGFYRAPLDEQVCDLCGELGLSTRLAARWRELPDPDAAPATQPAPDPSRRESG